VTFWLGPPGNLQPLPDLARGIKADMELNAAVHTSLSGVRAVDYLGEPKRTYSASRQYLTRADVHTLETLAMGLLGPPPYALIDPYRVNVIAPNIATGGDFRRSTSGYIKFGGALATMSLVGPGSAAASGRYNLSLATPASGTSGSYGVQAFDVTSTAAAIATAIPVLPSTPYTFQVKIRSQAGTPQAYRASIMWLSSTGTQISNSDGVGSVPTGTYDVRTVQATSPSTAAYAGLQVLNSGTLTATNTIYLDEWMLSASTTVDPWVVGTGTPKVAFMSLSDSYSHPTDHDMDFVLVEVG